MRNCQRRVAQLAGNPQVVARPCAAAPPQAGPINLADRGYADRHRPVLAGDARRARGIAADQLASLAGREFEHPARKGLEPGTIGARQRQRQQETARPRTGRSQIRQVHRQCLVSERGRIDIRKEMDALGQQVGRDRQGPFTDIDQRAVVTDALALMHRAREVARNQLEFVQRTGLPAPASSARIRAASLSSTPFTYRKPSLPPKSLASSMASLITTLCGISGR